MLAVSLPTSATASALVESATKCRALAAVAAPRAAAHPLGEFAHLRKHGVDLGHHVGTAGIDGMVVAIAQRHMQHRTVFGDVDVVAAEHLLRPATNVGLAREIHQ